MSVYGYDDAHCRHLLYNETNETNVHSGNIKNYTAGKSDGLTGLSAIKVMRKGAVISRIENNVGYFNIEVPNEFIGGHAIVNIEVAPQTPYDNIVRISPSKVSTTSIMEIRIGGSFVTGHMLVFTILLFKEEGA